MIQTRPYFYPSSRNSWPVKKQEKASSPDATNHSNFLQTTVGTEHQHPSSWVPHPPITSNLRFGYNNPKRSERLAKTEEVTEAFKDSLKEIQKAKNNSDLPIINLGVGDSDIPPSPLAIQAMIDSLGQINHGPKVTRSYRYIPYNGDIQFFKAVSQWMKQRFNVDIVAKKEVIAVNGASDGIDTILSAYTNPGDAIIIPNPGHTQYPAYLAKYGVEAVPLQLTKKNGYMPSLDNLSREISKGALKNVKGIILNYPHNPSGVMATREYLEKIVRFAREHDLFIIYDNDNSETFHDVEKPLGIMQIEGAKEVSFDVHTMSKAFGMPGLRVGFVVSNKDFIDALHDAHAMVLSSVPTHLQLGAAAALLDTSYNERVNRQYQERAKWVTNELEKLGAKFIRPEGTFYLWVPVPSGFTSVEFCKYVMKKTNVMLGHGNAFGSEGDGYIRIALAEPANAIRDGVEDPIKEAFRRLKNADIRFDRPKQMQSG